MSRPSVLLLLGALLLVYAATADASSRRNVLFIVTDDMNNDLGCYGHPVVKTPALDRLAERGMRFDRAYCQVPLCNPSRVSFLSGRRPETTRVFTLRTPTRAFLPDTVMLPEHFRKQGYFTAQVGKIFHTGDGHEDPRSWDVEIREFGKFPPPDAIHKREEVESQRRKSMYWAILKSTDADTPDGFVARKAIALMEETSRAGKSFFLGVGFRRPHSPYAAPKKYFDLYPPASVPLAEPPPPNFQLLESARNFPPRLTPLSEHESRGLVAAYYACNSFVDAQVKVLLEALDRLNLWRNTVVVFVSDHGYHLGDHGGLWHKNSLFDVSARVPLLVYAPGMLGAGKTSGRIVELVDLYPTLTELCGLPASEGLEGLSFAPLLDAPERPWKEGAYSVASRAEDPADNGRSHKFLGRSVRTERWRYTEWDAGRKGVELYDHETDSAEVANLARHPEHMETVRRLRKLLRSGTP